MNKEQDASTFGNVSSGVASKLARGVPRLVHHLLPKSLDNFIETL